MEANIFMEITVFGFPACGVCKTRQRAGAPREGDVTANESAARSPRSDCA